MSSSPRTLLVHTALAPDQLLVRNATVREELGRLTSIDVDLLSPNESLDLDSVLGAGLAIEVVLPGGDSRFFHGLVAEISQTGRLGRYATYSARAVPWLWLLTRASDCRIYQQQGVPDIIKSVFREAGTSDFEDSLSGSYSPRDYCVQYMETDFNFVSRLMEEEGIYYYFKHEKEKDTLVLCDSGSAHSATPNYESFPYLPDDKGAVGGDFVKHWQLSHSMQSGKLTHTDFDFTKPRTSLITQYSVSRDYPKSDAELFEYPGGYVAIGDGNRYAQRRLESIQHQYERVGGSGDLPALAVGALFSLEGHPRDDQNAEYLVVSAVHHFKGADYESGSGQGGESVVVQFEAIPSKQPYRTPLTTWKARVPGPQTAIVVGKAGDEITVDEYGRVKVQFHWDRKGKRDENSSCWLRVSQVWAGKNWGAMHIPRIGQEVIVSFLEGDPDRPIITGRVYNAAEMPPYDLPENKSQSGIKSRSTLGGSPANFNEIRFEDKMGSELLMIHAEKDQSISVENDETHSVGHDRNKSVTHDETTSIGNNRTETVGNDESITITRDRTMLIERDKTETVVRNKTITVAGMHAETIAKTMEINVGSSLSENVAINYSEVVGAAMELTVGAALAVSVGAVMSEVVGGAKAQTVGGSFNEATGGSKTVDVAGALSESVEKSVALKIGEDLNETISGQHTETVTKEFLLQAKKIQFKADDELSIVVGSAELVFKKNGEISISGDKITIKASGDLTLKGSKIAEN
jgi:type VI secretion system secreted protein VgrG